MDASVTQAARVRAQLPPQESFQEEAGEVQAAPWLLEALGGPGSALRDLTW